MGALRVVNSEQMSDTGAALIVDVPLCIQSWAANPLQRQTIFADPGLIRFSQDRIQDERYRNHPRIVHHNPNIVHPNTGGWDREDRSAERCLIV